MGGLQHSFVLPKGSDKLNAQWQAVRAREPGDVHTWHAEQSPQAVEAGISG